LSAYIIQVFYFQRGRYIGQQSPLLVFTASQAALANTAKAVPRHAATIFDLI